MAANGGAKLPGSGPIHARPMADVLPIEYDNLTAELAKLLPKLNWEPRHGGMFARRVVVACCTGSHPEKGSLGGT